MQAVDEQLVRPDLRLVLLFTPPFDHSTPNPGYIKGYPPGIRENGGQYTHAALWVIQALALLGRGTRAVELFDMLNPVLGGADRIDTYRVEPYAVAADVYGEPFHPGRGGWTWYTGSAAWMYRVAMESILGVELRGDRLRMSPCIPRTWPGFEIILRRGSTAWRIAVSNPAGVERGLTQIKLDGRLEAGAEVRLIDDGSEHVIEIELGSRGSPASP
jgi:cyclic beta-1,2-glucan synthetase